MGKVKRKLVVDEVGIDLDKMRLDSAKGRYVRIEEEEDDVFEELGMRRMQI